MTPSADLRYELSIVGHGAGGGPTHHVQRVRSTNSGREFFVSDGDLFPSIAYHGSRPGYVYFRSSKFGTGYYRNGTSPGSCSSAESPAAVAAAPAQAAFLARMRLQRSAAAGPATAAPTAAMLAARLDIALDS